MIDPNQNQLLLGDCLEVMKDIPSDSIDTIISDPPYGLSFMGKKWDYDVPSIEIWKECLRVLKPGGTALIFAGTRTQHRMACNIEDAGFILKDCIMWLYGSGFPKATDISKQLDKGHERIVVSVDKTKQRPNAIKNRAKDDAVGKYGMTGDAGLLTKPFTEQAKLWNGWKSHGLKPAYEPILVCMKQNDGTYAENALTHGVSGLNIDGGRIEPQNEKDLKDIRSERLSKTSNANKHSLHHGKLEGLDRSNRQNIQGRFPANIILSCNCEYIKGELAKKINDFEEKHPEIDLGWFSDLIAEVYKYKHNSDCPVHMLDEQSGKLKSGKDCKRTKEGFFGEHGGLGKAGDIQITYGDKGGASRFFYCAKASKSERNEGCEDLTIRQTTGGGGMNNTDDDVCGNYGSIKTPGHNHHPTVKPLKLMEYLCTLTKTPTGGVVLDPFMGSGTTGIACINMGRKFIGIELNKEYFEIAKKRILDAKQNIK